MKYVRRARQRGAAAVEFALVSVTLFLILFGVMDFGLMAYQWNAAAEATRDAARVAVVCDKDAAVIKDRVQVWLPSVTDAEITVTYLPANCTALTCEEVTVRIAATQPMPSINPLMPDSMRLPSASTTLRRESMASTVGGVANPMCS
jgi:Flp pilus assembly protein TadG